MQSFPCNSAEHFAQLHFLISNFLSSMAIWRFRFDHFRFQKYSRFTKSLKSKLKVMHQSFETPASPHSGLSGAFTFYPSESEWSLRSPGTIVSRAFPRLYCSTHTCGTPFVKQLTNRAHGLKDAVGSYEVKTFLSGHQISCKGSSMPKDCQNVFMVEVVSLILGWKNWQWNTTGN